MKYLILGIGNKGEKYENTRHNIGFKIVEKIAEKIEAKFNSTSYGWLAEGKYKGRKVLLLKPDTYVNLSGNALKYWMQKENISLENLLVITDDLALPFGTLRLKGKGSDAGHNGLKNIQDLLRTQAYARLRFGISSDFERGRQVIGIQVAVRFVVHGQEDTADDLNYEDKQSQRAEVVPEVEILRRVVLSQMLIPHFRQRETSVRPV